MTKRFLLIDDDSDDRELFSETLANVDPASICVPVPDGEEAFLKLSTKQIDVPDMIFLDINMPIMSGWQVLSRIKGSKDYDQIPVIIYSTSTSRRDREMARDMGALCFFTKPSNHRTLRAMLEIVVMNMNTNSIRLICESIRKLNDDRN